MSHPSQYLEQLLYFANEDLPQLNHDLVNASTLYTLQAAVQRMHSILTYLTHSAILNIYHVSGSLPRPPAPAPVRQAQAPQTPVQAQQPTPRMAIGPAPIPLDNMTERQPAQAQVSGPAEVFVTPQGSRVHMPGMPVAAYPAGALVDTANLISQRAPQPPTSMPYLQQQAPMDINLPQGGGLPPEVAAALAARSGGSPAIDARDITNEPPA